MSTLPAASSAAFNSPTERLKARQEGGVLHEGHEGDHCAAAASLPRRDG